MKILRVGDPHIKPSNIEEADRLMHFINDKILELKPDRVELLGDLFHTHGIIRMEVLEFWDAWLDILSESCELIGLEGNHDIAGADDPNARSFSALRVFRHIKKKNLKLVNLPRVEGVFAYMPYCATHEYFIECANACAKEGAKVLVCHQTFDGSYYENGFYAPDGIDPKLINFNLIISGHIHTRQDIQKDGQRILYIGTPKWDTVSDANEKKGIWMYEHDDQGRIVNETFISTAEVCTPIVSVTWIEGEPQPEFPKNAKTTVELVGSSKWIDATKALLKGTVSISTKITDKANRKERVAGNSFPEFVAKRFVTDIDRIELLKYMKEIEIV